MSRRAKRPLDATALKKADDAFYAKHPEMVVGGKRRPIPANPSDPCAARLREEWLDDYVVQGGKIDTVALPACKPGSLMSECPVKGKPLTEDQANEVFKKLAANKDIPFDYPVDCCYSRAHLMAGMMENLDVDSKKFWLFNKKFGQPGATPDLHAKKAKGGSAVTFPNPMTGVREPVEWVYHVAPIVEVRKSNGTVVDMVMDPSLSDRPLTKAEWIALQDNPMGAYTEESDKKVYFGNKKLSVRQDDPDMSEACKQVALHKLDRDAALATEAARKAP